MMASVVDLSFMMIFFGYVLCPDLLQPDVTRIGISIAHAIGKRGTILSQSWIARRVSFPMGKADLARSGLIQNGGAVITERW